MADRVPVSVSVNGTTYARQVEPRDLLVYFLRETLGTHVKQAGSLVAPDRLRFDFSHYQGLGPRELTHIQNRVNEQVLRNAVLTGSVFP